MFNRAKAHSGKGRWAGVDPAPPPSGVPGWGGTPTPVQRGARPEGNTAPEGPDPTAVWPVLPPDPTSGWAPDGRRRARRWPERLILLALLAATASVLAVTAVHNDHAAMKWRQLDQAQVRISADAARQVQVANASIGSLNSEVRSLDAQVSSVQSQLSNVANQKEKAIDQTTVLRDLLAAAGQVANNLQECISATDQLDTDLNAAVASGQVSALNALQNEAASVDGTCQQAQNGNNALQAAIQTASS